MRSYQPGPFSSSCTIMHEASRSTPTGMLEEEGTLTNMTNAKFWGSCSCCAAWQSPLIQERYGCTTWLEDFAEKSQSRFLCQMLSGYPGLDGLRCAVCERGLPLCDSIVQKFKRPYPNDRTILPRQDTPEQQTAWQVPMPMPECPSWRMEPN